MSAGYTIHQIAKIVGGRLVLKGKEVHLTTLLTDSRKLSEPAATLFFALHGPRRSGESFVPDLYTRGVRNFVVSDTTVHQDYTEANFIYVNNVLAALQQLAGFHRSNFKIPVIGITGSNGKTIVKEWLYQMLEDDFTIVRSPKSYNSQIGVALSVWQIKKEHSLGIFEAGISQPGEMQHLQGMIQPTIGVFTNLGDAHGENFTSLRQKATEKVQLFRSAEYVVANGDNAVITGVLKAAGCRFVSFGKKSDCAVQVTATKSTLHHTVIGLHCNPDQSSLFFPDFDISIPFSDDAAVENVVAACCVLLCLHYPPSAIQKKLERLRAVSMRLELKKGINQCSIVNDSYIADTHSLNIALDFLQQQPQPKKTVILSDLLETGFTEPELYRQIATLLRHAHIAKLVGIGPAITTYQALFQESIRECIFFPSTEDFLKHFHSSQYKNEAILVKGARRFAFERICSLLDQKAHQTVMEINLSSILHNLRQHQNLLQPATKIMVMVKAFSYGSGSFEIANLLQFHKVDYLAVAYADEGVELRTAGITLPIMVMNPEESGFAAMVEHYLEPELFSMGLLKAFQDFLKREGLLHYPVHLKIDTGMHRLGFELKELSQLTASLADNNFIKVQSVFSHLAGSEDAALDYFTQQQAATYAEACKQLESVLAYPFIKHIANSAAIVRHPGLQFDMVRLGIGLYGINTANTGALDLKEAVTLKTTIAQIKKVAAGETVGYGRRGSISREATIATIRIGYADGYRRCLSNGMGKVLIRGQLAPVVGSIAMDMAMVDVSGIGEVQENDEVIIFGPGFSVTHVADWANTIPYEMLTGISQRVQRVYFEE